MTNLELSVCEAVNTVARLLKARTVQTVKTLCYALAG
jgi:hypothetical protein